MFRHWSQAVLKRRKWVPEEVLPGAAGGTTGRGRENARAGGAGDAAEN